jgi:hypothetical protein
MNGLDRLADARFDATDDRIRRNDTAHRLDLWQRGRRVIFRADGTDRKAIVVATAWRAAVIGDAAVARLRGREVSQPDPGRGIGEALFPRAERHRSHGIRFRADGWPLQCGIRRPADAKRIFGTSVERLQSGVIKSPVATDAIERFQAHVLGRQAPADASPVPCGAPRVAHVTLLVGARVGAFELQILV